MTEANNAGTAKAPVRLKKIADMNADEKAVYDKMSSTEKLRYEAKLQLQEANDKIKEVKALEDKEKAERKARRERDTKIKNLVNEVKGGTLVIEKDGTLLIDVLSPKLDAIGIPKDEQKAVMEQIQKDSKTRQVALIAPRPAWTLTRSMAQIGKEQFIIPTDGNRPDVTLTNSVKKYGIISPFLVRAVQIPNETEGAAPGELLTRFYILDGKRRFWLLEENEKMDCIIISGFPSNLVEQKAEIVLNRVRSLNTMSTADLLQGMRTQGVTDADLRSDCGFKTGEVEKILSILDSLTPALQGVLRRGLMTPAVSFAIAKLPKELQTNLYEAFIKREGEGVKNNRVTEADVEALKTQRTEGAIKRDESLLNDVTGGVEDFKTETEGGETPAPNPENPPAPALDNPPNDAVNSKSDTQDGFWQEKAFAGLELTRVIIPGTADASVKDAFSLLVTEIAKTSEMEFAAEPDIDFQAKEVKGWQKSAFKTLGKVGSVLDEASAPDAVYQALDALNKALQGK